MIPPLPPDDALLRLARAVQATGYGFTTPTPATHARVNALPENALARDLRGVFGWSRRFRPDVLPPDLFTLMQEAGVAERDGDGWRSRVRLSTLDGLLFLHSAYPTTAADAVFFGPDTYRFARAVARHLERRRVRVSRAVDVGCGAGPGAVLLARALPGAEVLAVDINPAALRSTAVNAQLAGVAVAARRSDLLRDVDGLFDLVVANPPYLVDPGARAYRHGGGPLGAELSLAIARSACERLAPGGDLLLYTGAAVVNGEDPFRAAATSQLSSAGLAWTYEEVDPDVFGEEIAEGAYREADRIAAVVLTAHKNASTR
jgi:SAM-dependent methyltransferase